MSMGKTCVCDKTKRRVINRNHNHSAFSGYAYSFSEYSKVICIDCGQTWQTKSKYVLALPGLKKGEIKQAPELAECCG